MSERIAYAIAGEILMIPVLIELSALLSIWLLVNTWQRDFASPGRWAFIAMCTVVAVWTIVDLSELDGALDGRVSETLRLGLAQLLAPLWLVLGLTTRNPNWALRGRRRRAALLFVPFGIASLTVILGIDAGAISSGLLYGYGWALAAVGTIHFALSARRLPQRSDRARRVTIALVSAMPMVASIGFWGLGLPGIDPTPILLATALITLRSELFSGDLIRALPLSQHDFVGRLPVPILLTDTFGRVLDINPAAQHQLQIDRSHALQRDIAAILIAAENPAPFENWPLVQSGREIGRIYLPCDAVSSARGVTS